LDGWSDGPWIAEAAKNELLNFSSNYIEVRAVAYYRVSAELSTYKNMDMPRAWIGQRFVRVSATKARRF